MGERAGGVEKREAPLMTVTLKERDWAMAGSPSVMLVAQLTKDWGEVEAGAWPGSTPLTKEGMSLTGVTLTVTEVVAVPPCSSVTV